MTRFLTMAAFVALAAAAAPASAQAQQDQQQPQSITRATIAQETQASFSEIDANKDGFVTRQELETSQSRAVKTAEADRDQKMAAEFKRLDADNNGSLTLAEFKAAAPPVKLRVTPDEALTNFDSNKDGKISLDEYRGPRLALFDKTDSNHDGTVTAAEVNAARQQ